MAVSVCSLLLLLPSLTAAEESGPPATPAAATGAPQGLRGALLDRVSLQGYLDSYYSHHFGGAPRAPSPLRVFDPRNGTFMLAYAELALGLHTDAVSLRVDVGAGEVAELSSYDAQDPAAPGISGVFKNIQQAYASLRLPGGVTLDAGKFVTTAGLEVIEARDNWNYSRSLVFGYALPFTHTGVRVNVPVSGTLTLQGSVVNGWEVIHDNNRYKTLGLAALYAAPAGPTLSLVAYTGPEGERSGEWRTLLSLVALQEVTEQLSLGLDSAYGREGEAQWYGLSVLGRYAVSGWLRLAARLEHFADPEGARGLGARVNAATLTVGVPVGSNAELRAELRSDLADQSLLLNGGAPVQTTAQAAVLAWF